MASSTKLVAGTPNRRSALRLLLGGPAAAALLAACAEVPVRAPVKVELPVFPPPPEQPRFYFERAIYSDADVVPEAEASTFRRVLTGESRRGQGLGKPYGVAVWRGRVFVSDTVMRAVRVFDAPGGRVYAIGDEDGAGGLQKPIGLDVDAAGNLYVADISMGAVMIYDPDGKFLRRVGGKDSFQRLTSVTVDPAGERVYGVDIGGVGSDSHKVRVFDAASGEHLMDIGSRGPGPGQFNLPRDLAIGVEGRLYVVDGGNFRVVMFDRDGGYLATFGSVGRQLGQFARPKEIAIDRHGNVYVVDSAFGNFQIFDPDGQLLMFVGSRSERDGPAKYMLPSGIAVDEDGRVYVVDQWFRKIDVFRPAELSPHQGYLARRPPAASAAQR
ncbi:MAG: 6-bladed beta-propeller [Burkholderiales bacterium]|nr:MAG: 6-bladed beta-propeller [Burkholderiales bacterium]